ncbi:MAG: tyrosine-type recombinase/integrase [Eubacteriales bacterium]|nr:tyrosine-type recombinase/integrase [Eubacteriales bacterium]
MAKGENIFKRKDGRWEARYIKGRELSGKIKYGFCYGKTYTQAKEKVTLARAALLSGGPGPSAAGRHRFAFFCDQWLQAGRGRFKEATCVKYQTVLDRHIKPRLGSCYPLAFCDELVAGFTGELLAQALAPKTVKDILVVLRSILNYTAKQFPGTFPRVDIPYPREGKREMRVLTREEQGAFVGFLLADLDECRFGILLALLTGIRIGELCALRWENISLDDNTLKITATMQRLADSSPHRTAKTKILIGPPKSGTSARTIPLSDDAAALCRRMQPGSPEAYVLTGTAAYMEPRALQYRLSRYTASCGLEGVHFHTLRHTFATRCVEVGFEIKSLSEILGHASTTITLERYVHASMELKRDNMNKLTMVGL